jgi:CRP-like cAMP-binding protein
MADSSDHVLRRQGWLSATSRSFQDAVLNRCDLLTVSQGTPVFHAGDEAGGIYGVLDGSVELHLPSSGGAATLAHIAGAGAWFGDLAALRRHHRRFSLVARTQSRLLRLSWPELLRLCTDEPERWRHVAERVAANLSVAIDAIDALRRRDPVERVALKLLALAEGSVSAEQEVSVSQSELAGLACLSRGAVNGALATLESRGLIERRYRGVLVRDAAALTELVGKV